LAEGELAPKFKELAANLDQLVSSTLAQRQEASGYFFQRGSLMVDSHPWQHGATFDRGNFSQDITKGRSPIKAVTKVEATHHPLEGNYDLRAPVTTEDEIGILAYFSLNQLIERVEGKSGS